MDGTVAVATGEREWRFTPARPWRAGRYGLLILSILEDPSGNRLGRAFEVTVPEAEEEPPPPEQFTLPFDIR